MSKKFYSQALISIKNSQGLHLRTAGLLSQIAQRYKAAINIIHNNRKADVKSIIEILMLAVHCGETIELQAEGEDADQAIFEIKGLLCEE